MHLGSHCGGKLIWDEGQGQFRPDPKRPPTSHDGAAMVHASARPMARACPPAMPVWLMPQGAGIRLRSKMWLDYQNDVKVSDVQLAAREGYESVEHTKRYTTLGMATDQGKLSNINGLAVLAGALNTADPGGRHHHLPPALYAGAVRRHGGEARGDLFQPLRSTPIQVARGTGRYFEPVGQWRRPYTSRAPANTRMRPWTARS